ncbi:hemoglobin subunit zeta-like [Lepus europaeus]|uniref:hemoglobin subunit zeta-like n=1 Tax=Lepus europaeus TaxID=9983 RepID=UPI002B480794|nr:hemoglobin subunit zeta-like [Lepus europaeus]XP_062036440.1 hemoglobin subunit zeta-like [Lepus europaeus]
MSLTNSEKSIIMSLWDKVSSQAEAIGTEALERFFLSYPQSKPSFPQFDQLPGSAQLRARGAELAAALNDAVKNMDDMDVALSPLSDLLAYKLRVDPVNFRLLSHGLQVTLARYLPRDFTAETQAAWDKFLGRVPDLMTAKNR